MGDEKGGIIKINNRRRLNREKRMALLQDVLFDFSLKKKTQIFLMECFLYVTLFLFYRLIS